MKTVMRMMIVRTMMTMMTMMMMRKMMNLVAVVKKVRQTLRRNSLIHQGLIFSLEDCP
jgi:hypothetical protein